MTADLLPGNQATAPDVRQPSEEDEEEVQRRLANDMEWVTVHYAEALCEMRNH